MSHKRNNNESTKKKSQPTPLILNNTSNKNQQKKTEKRKQQNINIQTNRNSKQNNILFTHGDLKQLEQTSATGTSPLSPGLYSSSPTEDHDMQLAIQQSLQQGVTVTISATNSLQVSNTKTALGNIDATTSNHIQPINHYDDELEADFYDITSSDCEEEDDEDDDQEEDIENWELLDESSSSLINLNKPYSFSNIEFPVLKTPKSNSLQSPTNQPIDNPWLNSKVLIKSITQQS